MPVLNGLEAASALGFHGPKVVFATAYDEHALKAFEANAIDYLVKPIDSERLHQALEKIRSLNQHLSLSPTSTLALAPKLLGAHLVSRIALKCGQNFRVLDFESISAFLAADHYSEVLYVKEKILVDDSLDSILTRLPSQQFIRIHRSAIVNITFLRELKRLGDRKYNAILNDFFQSELPISREALKSVKAALNLP